MKIMALDRAGKALALRGAGYRDIVAGFEGANVDSGAHFQRQSLLGGRHGLPSVRAARVDRLNPNLTRDARVGAGGLQMAGLRLRLVLSLAITNLDGVVAVR